MARKRKGQEVPAKEGVSTVTYVGEHSAISYNGRSFLRGVPTPVDDVKPYINRAIFKVSHADAN